MTLPLRNFIRYVLRFSHPDIVKVSVDIGLILIAAGWTWLISFGQVPSPGSPLPFMVAVLCARLFIYFALRLHHLSWLHVSRYDVLWLALSAALGPIAIGLLLRVLPEPFTLRALVRPDLILAAEPAFYLVLLCGARITARALASDPQDGDAKHRVLIVGAGAAARSLAFQIQEQKAAYHIVGLVDDNRRLHGRRLRGLRVLGSTDELPRLVRELSVQEIVIAIPSLEPERLRELLAICEPLEVPVRTLPPLREMIGDKRKVDPSTLREVRMEDLLPRPEVQPDHAATARYLGGKSVLVTGGGGSIGGELCRQAVAAGANNVLVLGRGENSVFEMVQELCESNGACGIVPVVCDVRDRPALDRIFARHRPDVVFHAAAHKHVPMMEQYPSEAIKNNVVGTLNVVELSLAHKVESFVMVSTDKAVEPCNVMGASKRICEMIVKGYAAQHHANMVCVRFGNVLGSRGSVVPTMRSQIRRRLPVTVTDPDMVRFFMTIPEAVQLILQAGAIGGCGEVFVLDMGRPVRILDLAHDLIRLSGLVPDQDIEVRIIGKRPGEKMYEDILTSKEAEHAEKNGPFFMAAPQNVELPALLEKIERLRTAGEHGEDAQIPNLIREVIPDFCPDENTPLQIGATQNNRAMPVEP